MTVKRTYEISNLGKLRHCYAASAYPFRQKALSLFSGGLAAAIWQAGTLPTRHPGLLCLRLSLIHCSSRGSEKV